MWNWEWLCSVFASGSRKLVAQFFDTRKVGEPLMSSGIFVIYWFMERCKSRAASVRPALARAFRPPQLNGAQMTLEKLRSPPKKRNFFSREKQILLFTMCSWILSYPYGICSPSSPSARNLHCSNLACESFSAPAHHSASFGANASGYYSQRSAVQISTTNIMNRNWTNSMVRVLPLRKEAKRDFSHRLINVFASWHHGRIAPENPRILCTQLHCIFYYESVNIHSRTEEKRMERIKAELFNRLRSRKIFATNLT